MDVSEIDSAKDTLHEGGTRCCQSYMEYADGNLSRHEKRHRNPNAESAEDSVKHYKLRMTGPVEITVKAEHEACQHAVDGIGFQVLCARTDDFRVVGKKVRQNIAVKEGKPEDENADSERNELGIPEPLDRTVVSACTAVLRHEGRKRLRQGGWDEHNKTADLFSYSHTGAHNHTKGIYKCKNHEEGHTNQEFL